MMENLSMRRLRWLNCLGSYVEEKFMDQSPYNRERMFSSEKIGTKSINDLSLCEIFFFNFNNC